MSKTSLQKGFKQGKIKESLYTPYIQAKEINAGDYLCYQLPLPLNFKKNVSYVTFDINGAHRSKFS